MKISEVMKVVKPQYSYFKLTPNYSIRNNKTNKIARSISSIHKNIHRRIKCDESKIINAFGKDFLIGTKYSFNTQEKVSYFIHIEKSSVQFFMIIPSVYEKYLKEKLTDTWSGLTVKKVDEIPDMSKSLNYEIVYNKEDALSLSSDLRNNDLLRSNLNVVNVLEPGDSVGILYNFIPMNQTFWAGEYRQTMEKINDGYPVHKDKGNVLFILKFIIVSLTKLLNVTMEELASKQTPTNESKRVRSSHSVSESTSRKKAATIVGTQIMVMSKSNDKLRERSNAKSVIQSFDTITDDNKLVSKRFKKDVDFTRYNISSRINKMSDYECQNFLSLAGRDILEEHNFIDKIITKETEVPMELQEGTFYIGDNVFKGNKQKAFLNNDEEYKNLSLLLIGPSRSGKSTLIQNLSVDAIENEECVVVFDFIKNCELSEEVREVVDKDKVLVIDCGDQDKIQGLGYNEVGFSEDTFKQYDNAKRQTTQLMALVNSINSDDTSLTAKMERYLTSAALVVFINGGSIKDVFDVLQDHETRVKYISDVPSGQSENMREYITALRTLDEVDKQGVVNGTKINLIVGIIDRLNKLKANTYMEMMLKTGTENNIDLSKEIQKNQLICIQMPEDMFSTDGERDVYTTYWITKLWLSLQMRAKRIKSRKEHVKVNLIIDEIYQVNNTERFVTDKLSRFAKFSLKPIISCHYINQLKYMRSELRSANASYMLISGCDKFNYNEFKEELYPYEVEDLLNLVRYDSLNLIKSNDGMSKFITKLPGPIAVNK